MTLTYNRMGLRSHLSERLACSVVAQRGAQSRQAAYASGAIERKTEATPLAASQFRAGAYS
jgi:spore coat protein CotH